MDQDARVFDVGQGQCTDQLGKLIFGIVFGYAPTALDCAMDSPSAKNAIRRKLSLQDRTILALTAEIETAVGGEISQ